MAKSPRRAKLCYAVGPDVAGRIGRVGRGQVVAGGVVLMVEQEVIDILQSMHHVFAYVHV